MLSAAFRGQLTREIRQKQQQEETAIEFLNAISDLRRKHWLEFESKKAIRKYKKPNLLTLGQKYRTPDAFVREGPEAIPDEWAWASVEALSVKVTDGVHKKPNYVEAGVPFVTVKNLTASDGITFENLNYITEEDHQKFIERTHPEKGDILITKDGTLGIVRAIRTDEVFSVFVSVALVKPVDYSMTDFLELAFTSPQVQKQMVGVGSGLQHIHLTDLRKDLIPVPPRPEQEAIVRLVRRMFEFIDRLVSEQQQASKLLEKLDQSILAKAFRGELVPQDPNDEPASVLLERIQAERAGSPKTKRARRAWAADA